MPEFQRNPLEKITLKAGDAKAELDLRGLQQAAALARVAELLKLHGPAGSYRICFDPPTGDGAETLFLPLGRLLLDARRQGVLDSCLPLSDGAGYFIAFRPKADC